MRFSTQASQQRPKGIYEQGLAVYREIGADTFAARMTNTVAQVALAHEDFHRADALASEALIGFTAQRDQMGVAEALDTLAAVAPGHRDSERAARLDGAAAAIHARIASKPAPFEQAIVRRLIQASEAVAGRDHWQVAWTAGNALNLDAAVDYALERQRRTEGGRRPQVSK